MGNYTASNGSTSYTVPQATPAVGISAALHRGTLTFTATVTGPAGGPTPTGTGTWTVAGPGGVSVCGSTTALTGTGNPPGTATATCVFANHPAPGSYTLTYAYNGDGNYNPARAGPTTFQIPRFSSSRPHWPGGRAHLHRHAHHRHRLAATQRETSPVPLRVAPRAATGVLPR